MCVVMQRFPDTVMLSGNFSRLQMDWTCDLCLCLFHVKALNSKYALISYLFCWSNNKSSEIYWKIQFLCKTWHESRYNNELKWKLTSNTFVLETIQTFSSFEWRYLLKIYFNPFLALNLCQAMNYSSNKDKV